MTLFLQYTFYQNWFNIDYIFTAFYYQLLIENDNIINFCWFISLKSESFIMKSVKKNYDFGRKVSHLLWSRWQFWRYFSLNYFLNWYQTIKTVNGTLICCFNNTVLIVCSIHGVQYSLYYVNIVRQEIRRRQYRTHTLRVRTLAFGLKMKIAFFFYKELDEIQSKGRRDRKSVV